jgi:hypothetical protein
VTGAPATGRYYARIAELEAAAVIAFDFMLLELTEAGAPEALLGRVEDARRDEVRHAHVMAALAGRYGAEVTKPHVAPRQTPTLLEMALENMAEGCVRETWGALSARYQSQAAESFAERLLWSEVADDEARHAELSWDLHAWLMSRLSHAEQLEVEAAQRNAWDELVLELDAEPDREVQHLAGVPSRSMALELARDPKLPQRVSSRHPTVARGRPPISSLRRSPDEQIGSVLLGPSYRARLPTPNPPCLANKKSGDYTPQPTPRPGPFFRSLALLQSNVGLHSL